MTTQQELPTQVLESINTAVLLFDAELYLRYINPAGEMLFKVSSRHLLNQPLTNLMQYEAEHMPDLLEALNKGQHFTKHELKLTLQNHDEITVDLTASILQTTRYGRAFLFELSSLDRLLRISRDENLWSQQQATRQLLRSLAHEVKNPLGGLRGAAQLLEKELHSEELKEYTRVIIGEADRLQTLVDRILGPRNVPHKRLTNIHEIFERVRSLVMAEVDRMQLSIARDYDTSLPDLFADPDQLIQAVLNIVRNAVQAMEGRGKMILRTRILSKHTIGQTRHRLVIRASITDNGPGVPEELKDKIFFPMITGRADGTGLGLSIAQSLVQQHGGLIECASEPGKTTFDIYLPIEEQR